MQAKDLYIYGKILKTKKFHKERIKRNAGWDAVTSGNAFNFKPDKKTYFY